MKLHELFNQDDPTCLYCHSKCDVTGFGEAMMVIDTYTCQQCKEQFSIGGIIGEPRMGFTFTCNGIRIHHNYELQSFGLNKIQQEEWKSSTMWVPEFPVDFSKKSELFQKLKIYLTFA